MIDMKSLALTMSLLCLSPIAAGQEQTTYVYDLRDVALMLAESEDEEDALHDLVERLAHAADVGFEGELMRGVFLIDAPDGGRERFEDLVWQVRELHMDRYELELVVMEIEGEGPSSGEELDAEGELVFRTTRTLARGAVVEFGSLWVRSYVASWQPIVGTNAVAYEPTVEEFASGAEFAVQIGRADAPDDIGVRLWGSLREGWIELQPGPAVPHAASGEPVAVGLPNAFEMTFNASRTIPMDELTVLASMTVEDEDADEEEEEIETIVIGVRVTELAD